MDSAYLWLKTLHVLSAIVWVGGVIAITIINARVASSKDYAALAALSKHGAFFGMSVLGPAAIVTLLAGFAMLAVAGGGMGSSLWVIWGLVSIILSFVLGATLVRVTNTRLSALAPTAEPGNMEVMTLQQRLVNLNILNIVILLSAVGAMVLKPTL